MKKFFIILLMLLALPAAAPGQTGKQSGAPVSPYVDLITAALEAGDQEKALSLATEALLSLDGKNKAFVYSTRGLIYYQMGKNAEAFSDINEAARLAPDDPLPFETRGAINNAAGKTAFAILDFDRAIELGSTEPDVYTQRGEIHLMRNNRAAAAKMFNRALELDPENTEALFQRAYLISSSGCFDNARADYEKVINRVPDDARALNNRGIVLGWTARFDDAIRDFREAILIDIKYSSAWSNLGYTLYQKGDIAAALTAYDKAEETGRGNPYPICNRAEAYFSQGDLDKTRGAVKRCIKAAEDDPRFSTDEALYIEIVKRMRKLLDGSTSIPGYDELIAAADKAYENNNRLEAIINYALAYMKKPSGARAAFGMGKTYDRLGKYSYAAGFLTQYLAINPGGADALEAAAILDRIAARDSICAK